MISVFDEASRDYEREEKERYLHTASSMVNQSVLPFVSSSRNQEQYVQYKALVDNSLRSIASQCNLEYDEVSSILDQKMSYLLEAQEMELSKVAENERFYIIDGRGKRVGGSYSSRETAQNAIRKGEVKSSTGLRVIPAEAYRARSQATASVDQDASEGHVDPFKALASLRQALQEGVNPLEWINKETGEDSSHEGVPSEHNTGPSNTKEANANVNSPIPSSSDSGVDAPTTEHVNVPTPDVQMSGGTPTSSPMEQTRHMPNNPLGPSVSKIKEEIARYNPQLSQDRIESIAIKVASRYFVEEEER